MSKLKVNAITNLSETAGVIFTKGATIPSGYQVDLEGDVNITGIATIANLNLTGHTNVSGVLTSTTYIGDGSNLTGVPTVANGKVFALKQIISFTDFSKA